MGDKIAAKRVAVEAGVPTLPSSEDLTATDAAIDDTVGYPLLVKASAGGGGKGMRIVESSADLVEAVAAAQREALSGFGDDTVFLERYVASSRHVEIQVMGDSHGNVVHLGERECSIQRRHQKIVEESPSPVVDDEMRAAMGEAALALARHMGYESAGTVEFLVDDDTHEFFFLEVNTRLQVEHPVTEEVTGIDLVREQLRIAGGEELGYDQDSITWSGSAIEVRLYAEDPSNGFLPATGTLSAYRPADEPVVRWDSGVEEERRRGRLRPDARQGHRSRPDSGRGRRPLGTGPRTNHLGGVVTNRDFLVATLRNEAFLAGDTTTDFIDRIDPACSQAAPDTAMAAIVAAMWIQAATGPTIECGASLARTSAPDRCPLSTSSSRPAPMTRIGLNTRCVATADSHSAQARPCSCTSGPPTTSNSRSTAVACGRQSRSRTASAMSRSDERP